jgi:hypothetical protein
VTEPKRSQNPKRPKKLQVARLLRRETTMSLHWIAKRLRMGAVGSLANLLRREK